MLILGNKIDNPGAASEEELRAMLQLETTGKGGAALHPNQRPVELFMCSIVKRFGYGEGFKWMAKYVA